MVRSEDSVSTACRQRRVLGRKRIPAVSIKSHGSETDCWPVKFATTGPWGRFSGCRTQPRPANPVFPLSLLAAGRSFPKSTPGSKSRQTGPFRKSLHQARQSQPDKTLIFSHVVYQKNRSGSSPKFLADTKMRQKSYNPILL